MSDVPSLVTFTDDQFQSLMREEGLENVVAGVVKIAEDKLGSERVNLQSLRSGEAPILDLFPGYANLPPEKRQLTFEEILTIFTNVEDYGKFDDSGEGAGTRAFVSGLARTAPETIAGGYGFGKGVALASPYAAMIPPALGLFGLAAKGVVLGVGGITGALLSAFAADEVEKQLIGEQPPIIPSLQSQRNWAETTALGLSLLNFPRQVENIANPMAKNVEFLQNFKNVASGDFAAKLNDITKNTAKNAGLSEKYFKMAQEAMEKKNKLGTMFGKGAQKNLGIKFFNPGGYLFDPTKGPISERIATSISKGIGASLEFARKKPKRFIGIEGGAAAGAGAFAAVAQETDPYDPSTRFLYEVAGSAIVPIPAQIIADKGPETINSMINAVRAYAGRKKEDVVSNKLQRESAERFLKALRLSEEFDDQTGEVKLQQLIKALAEEGPSLSVSTFVKEKDLPFARTILDIERELIESNKRLSVASEKGREQFMERALTTINTLVASGDPNAIQIAARLEQKLFEENIENNISFALEKHFDAIKRVVGDEPLDPSRQKELSESLYNVLDQQIKASKKRENELWKATGNLPLTTFTAKNGRVTSIPNTLRIMNQPTIRGGLRGMSEAEIAEFETALGSLNKDVETFRKYFLPRENDTDVPTANPVTTAKLYSMRQIALEKAAQLKANNQRQASFAMSKFADAILRDMQGADNGNEAYNKARAYTNARNNVFTRSFYGDLQVFDRNRSLRLSPEQLHREFFKGGNDKTSERVKEIFAGVQFGVDHGLPEELFNQLTTKEAMDILIRDSLKKFVSEKKDPITNKTIVQIDQGRLNRWRQSPGTKELFSIFPTLELDTRTASKAKTLLDSEVKPLLARGESPAAKAFQNVIKYQMKPMEAVSEALKADDPIGALQELVTLANKRDNFKDPITGTNYTSAQAREGLKRAILDHAQTHSGQTGLLFNPTSFYNKLYTRIKGTDPGKNVSMMEFMLNNDIIDKETSKQLEKAIKEMRGVEEAFFTGNLESVLFKNPSPAKLFQARVLGATLGERGQGAVNELISKFLPGSRGLGGGIIAAEAGSQAVVNMLIKGPETQRLKLLSEALADKNILGKLLEDISTKEKQKNVFKSLEALFSGLARQAGRRLPYGAPLVGDVIEEDLPEPEVQQEQSVPPSNQYLPTPLERPVPTPVPAPVPASTPAPPPQNVAQGPVDRSRFAALFPEDADLIRGIGSLG